MPKTPSTDSGHVAGSFDFIEARIRCDQSGHALGRDFERLCKWFLNHAPTYRGLFDRVWLWNEWPDRWGGDTGIDLVARTHAGELWAIQSKAHHPDRSIPKRELDSFLSESSRPVFSYRLLIASTDDIGRNARRTIAAQEKPVGMVLRGDLLAAEVRWPTEIGRDAAPQPKRKPRPHQQTAIRNVLKGFRTHDRGQLIMACGTGKTLTALWIAERLKSRQTLVLVPSLSLISQNLREWGRNAARDFEYLVVCSDESVRDQHEDAAIQSTSDLGIPVTTDPQAIRAFLNRRHRCPAVVFATYQSSDRVAEAQARRSPMFDLIIADEAHRCVGATGRQFTTVLDGKRIKARKRLFMTATPRYFREHIKRKAAELDLELVSMDDESKFGPEFHQLSFPDAIAADPPLLTDYQVVIIGVTDREARKWAEEARLVRTAEGLQTDARTLASQIGLAKAIKKYKLTKVITFHSSVAKAQRFTDATASDSLPGLISRLSAKTRPSGRFWTSHINGKTPAGRRQSLLHKFGQLPSGTRGILSNCACLGEGVDVPVLDGIAFIDPRRSMVDIIQAVGRVIRKADKKEIGTVVVPVFIEESDDPDDVLTRSAFEPVWQVLKALRAHDRRLADQLDQLRLNLGRQSNSAGPLKLPDRIRVDLPELLLPDFERRFFVRTVHQTTVRQFRPFLEARKFVRALGLKGVSEWAKYCNEGLAGYEPKPDDIPSNPNKNYRYQGWVNWGDWLGTGTIATFNRQYQPFEEARNFVRALGLKNVSVWVRYCNGELPDYEPKPDDIPAQPNKKYSKKGWVGYGDWLGTGSIAPFNRQFRPIVEARKFVRALGLKGISEWRKYCKGELAGYEPKPDDIPANPWQTYDDQGWVDCGDWLGTGTIATFNRQYRPFEEARKFVRALGLKNKDQWNQYCKGQLVGYEPKPDNIPADPRGTYRDQVWVGWGDWLGTGAIAHHLRHYRPFSEARKFARALRLKSRDQWYHYCKGELADYEPKPNNIPTNPPQTYGDQGWVSWGDWLGTCPAVRP